MSDETEVEVPGTPDEAEDPATEPVVPEPPLDPSGTPSTEPSAPADVPTPTDTPVTDPAVPEVAPNPTSATGESVSTSVTSDVSGVPEAVPSTDTPEPPPVAGVVEVPPEPVAPPPPPPVADSVGTIDAADDQARAVQAEREAKAFALSTNGVVPPPLAPPPPLAGVADAPTVDRGPITGSTLWVCVTEEGPRTSIGGVACPIFLVERIPPQGQLLTCPTCGSTSVRQATEAEQQLP